MHDSLSVPPSPKSTFSDDQTTNHGPESYFVPDLPATLNSYQGNILFTHFQYMIKVYGTVQSLLEWRLR